MHLFRRACGLASPWVLRCQETADEDELESRLRLSLPFVLIGRDVAPGMRLPDPSVSRRHAYGQVIDGRLSVFDLESREGIVWEEAEAERAGRLESGGGLLIGPYRLSWRSEENAADPLEAGEGQVSAATSPKSAVVLPIRVDGQDAVWRLEADVGLVGRASGCGLILADESVSRFHAAFVRTPMGVWVVDLQGRGGVEVSGIRVRWAWLDHGDTVRIGRVMLGFRYLTPPSNICRGDVPLEAGARTAPESRKAVGASSRRGGHHPLQIRERKPAIHAPVPATVSGSLHGADAMELWKRQVEILESFQDDMSLMARMFFAMHQDQLATVRDEMTKLESLTAEMDELKARLEKSESKPETGDASVETQVKAGESAAASAARPKPKAKATAPKKSDSAEQDEDDPMLVHGVIIHRIASLQRERRSCWQRILGRLQS